MSAILIETRELSGKTLVCQIKVKAIGYTIHNKEYFSNKWLRFEDWLEIYAILDKFILNYEKISFKYDCSKVDEYMTSSGAEIKIAGTQISKSLKDIIGNDKTYLNTVLKITIGKLNIAELLDKINSLEKPLNNEINSKNSNSAESKHKSPVHDEYDPSASENSVESPNIIKYKPSAVRETKVPDLSDLCENEPYSPKPVESTDTLPEINECQKGSSPIYQPSKITKSKSHAAEEDNRSNNSEPSRSLGFINLDASQIKEIPRTAITRNCNTPLPWNDDRQIEVKKFKPNNASETSKKTVKDKQRLIFGSDDSGDEESNSRKKRTKENRKKRSKPSEQVAKVSIENTLAGWLTTETSSKHEKSIKMENKNQDIITENKIKTLQTNHRIAEVKALKKQRMKNENQNDIKALPNPRKEHPSKMNILNLKHLSLDDVSKTFNEFKLILDDLFEKRKKGPISNRFYGMNHLIVHNLVEKVQYRKLLDIINFYYEPDKNVTPQYDDLIKSVMVPEWILLLYMKEHNFTKKEAIKRISHQEDLSTTEASE